MAHESRFDDSESPVVLIIDDDAWIRSFLTNVLVERGYVVLEAPDVECGRALLRDLHVDLMLVDLTVGSLSGFDMIMEAQRAPSAPSVVVMTGYNRTDYAVRALEYGAFDFLAKPLDSQRLDLAIRRALENRRLRAEISRLSSEGAGGYRSNVSRESVAFYDSVTGLPNRSLFFDRLDQILIRQSQDKRCVALAVIAIGDLRRIGLAYGNDEADRVLTSVARTLESFVYKRDTVARVADNQIAVMAELNSCDRVVTLMEKLDSVVEAATLSENHVRPLRLDIGVALFPEDASNAEELYRHALSALDVQEHRVGGGHQLYRADRDAILRDQIRLERQLVSALTAGEYQTVLQPYHRVADGSVLGAEALLRWRPRNGAPIPPSRFVPILEANRGIVPVTEWIVRELGAVQTALIESGFGEQYLSLNVSPIQFQQLTDATRFVELVLECCPDPSRIIVELTESVFLSNDETVAGALQRLTKSSISIAFDDFGTGYSSLSYLTRYHVDYIKIDRSFVRAVDMRPDAATIVAAITSMARQLGIAVIAEGAETPEEAALLRECGCDFIQGFVYSRPLEPGDLTHYLRDSLSRIGGLRPVVEQ
jgi:diguanylate cyclase (GGDEF)-like protein